MPFSRTPIRLSCSHLHGLYPISQTPYPCWPGGVPQFVPVYGWIFFHRFFRRPPEVSATPKVSVTSRRRLAPRRRTGGPFRQTRAPPPRGRAPAAGGRGGRGAPRGGPRGPP